MHGRMSETADILAAIATLEASRSPLAVATVVSAEGSTYRRPGARLLIPADGAAVGNLSGGCLERDVVRIGREAIADGRPRLERFDLGAEGDDVWGYGLGCNGVIELFIEPTDGALQVAAALRSASEERRASCLVTVVASTDSGVRLGGRLTVWADGPQAGGIDGLGEAARALAKRVLASGSAGMAVLTTEGGEVRCFVEPFLPPPRLVVIGAGDDARPLVRHAAELGWQVAVADARRPFLTRERFPEAAGFVDAEPAGLVEAAELDEGTFVVLMTHNYLRDAEYLRAVVGVDLAYLGALGPRRRTEQLLRELGAGDAIRRIHAPVGLDLGAEGPEEVAWSIASEMLAVLRGREGGPLRRREAPIHD
jgi:xanthine dehydrogenase accessory factor